MSELWTSFAGWWVRCAAAGGLLLLLGLVLMYVVRQPARRERVGAWSIAAALFVVPLALLPGWLPLPWLAAQTVTVSQAAPAPLPLDTVEPLRLEALRQLRAPDAAPAPIDQFDLTPPAPAAPIEPPSFMARI